MSATLLGYVDAQVLGIRSFLSRRRVSLPVVVLSAVMAVAPAARAQSVTGSVSGTLVDSAGAVMAGVPVQLINEVSKQARENTTNGAGVFQFTSLFPGMYSLKVAKTG